MISGGLNKTLMLPSKQLLMPGETVLPPTLDQSSHTPCETKNNAQKQKAILNENIIDLLFANI
tara:strand:- start:38 stop:226 length:189 start_codon:yes stop_codon:yes gene_type:complete